MTPTKVLRETAAAARASGAVDADVFHRCSRTRFLLKEASGRITQGTRVEEGMGVRAWTADRVACGFAGGTGDSQSEALALGRQAARSLAFDPAAGGVDNRADERPADHDGADERESSAVTEDRSAVQQDAGPPVFDPAVLRLTPAELRRLLESCEEACGAVRRPGLLWALGIEMNVAVMESRLLRCDGAVLSRRSSLVSVQVRFPSAFGLGRVEMVTRRLADLDPSLLSRMLAPYPARADRLARADVRLSAEGDTTLTLAPSLVAALVVELTRQAARRGRPFVWASPATLDDNPLLDWGPGSTGWDAQGAPLAAQRLGGPAGGLDGASPDDTSVELPMLRPSVRQRPVAAPTNVVLSNVPAGGYPESARRLHLLEAVGSSAGTFLARGVARGPAGDEQAVLVRLHGPPENLFREELRAGSLRAFFAAGAFASAPELTLPGVEMEIG